MTPSHLFDLNIEEVLEHWEVEHAVREVIANALDEQLLTATTEVQIEEPESGVCTIRDFGRGLSIEHFTLSESEEKLERPDGIIGKFGVGLKDALATFHRRGIDVLIRSRHGSFRLREATKHNFDAITTLHVEMLEGVPAMEGTEVRLEGIASEDVGKAKALFLRFSGEQPVERTPYGEILRRGTGDARVYISGVLASEESNFLFSYNITHLTEGMKKRLNRERLNVGRTTYADRVKAMLKTAGSQEVEDVLAGQVAGRAQGTQCDEMQWIDVSQRALTILHDRERVTFVTEEEMALHPHVIDNMRADGYEVVIVDDAQKGKLEAQAADGEEVRTLAGYVTEYNESFDYEFIQPDQLDPHEQRVFAATPDLLALIGVRKSAAPRVLLSKTMRVGLHATAGVWDAELQAIVVKRSELGSLTDYAGTLLHEAAHALTGAVDATRQFESVLTGYLGLTSAVALTRG